MVGLDVVGVTTLLSRWHRSWCDFHSIGGEVCIVGSSPDGVSVAVRRMCPDAIIARSRSGSSIRMSRWTSGL